MAISFLESLIESKVPVIIMERLSLYVIILGGEGNMHIYLYMIYIFNVFFLCHELNIFPSCSAILCLHNLKKNIFHKNTVKAF